MTPTSPSPSPEPSNVHVTAPGQPTNPKDLLGLAKVPLRLVPPALNIFVAKVMELGAKKYGAFNWRGNSVRLTVYIEAAQRHLAALLDGQKDDEESGLPHAAHAAACMGIILDAWHNGNLIDDRPLPGPGPKLLSLFAEWKKPAPKPSPKTIPEPEGKPCGCEKRVWGRTVCPDAEPGNCGLDDCGATCGTHKA